MISSSKMDESFHFPQESYHLMEVNNQSIPLKGGGRVNYLKFEKRKNYAPRKGDLLLLIWKRQWRKPFIDERETKNSWQNYNFTALAKSIYYPLFNFIQQEGFFEIEYHCYKRISLTKHSKVYHCFTRYRNSNNMDGLSTMMKIIFKNLWKATSYKLQRLSDNRVESIITKILFWWS